MSTRSFDEDRSLGGSYQADGGDERSGQPESGILIDVSDDTGESSMNKFNGSTGEIY